MTFLFFLPVVDQVERLTLAFIGNYLEAEFLLKMVDDWHTKERGSIPSPIECIIVFWVFALIWKEIKQVRYLQRFYSEDPFLACMP